MGKVGLIYRILPEGVEVDLEKVSEEIQGTLPEGGELLKREIKPFAFGLKSLEVHITLDDRKGGAEELEGALKAIPGVQSVELLHMSLI
ncbi:MAG: elongation factor 1-beta [Thermoplasmata archaeon]|nr:elongation factor 1-beta [Thermoplasmata archaeon]HDD60327.1 elongation factor 1-beta [Euryarchaeota archaeon]RLF54240.1 MAG: elongation factor 1-beta [Thermoplasmata archaeon]RLF70221.1 MAG: elongation factor 1-beta [Thermoplasmata archaeon]RLF70249.1 MAG: elongation factor 1-beta [Thermoplasmata archaeon]